MVSLRPVKNTFFKNRLKIVKRPRAINGCYLTQLLLKETSSNVCVSFKLDWSSNGVQAIRYSVLSPLLMT